MNRIGIKTVIIALFVAALAVRAVLFYTVWGDLRHGSAPVYGSSAIGLYHGRGLTYHLSEMSKIRRESVNYQGDFLEYYEKTGRVRFVEFLPGPAVLLFSLWKIVPVFNFAPYIWLQILLDSLLVVLFYLVLRDYDRTLILIAAALMIVNLPTIKRTLMMGYDFWPQFIVLVNFIGISFFMKRTRSYSALLATGVLTALAIWCRAITTFLPFFVAAYVAVYLRLEDKARAKRILRSLAVYILPILISISLLSVHRYQLSGNWRPTRSTFWTMFIGGIGQFSNPYGLECTDRDIREFAEKANENIPDESSLEDEMPNSRFELTLKREAYSFITRYPHLVLRNALYRIGIMMSPLLHRDYQFIPRRLSSFLFPLGFPLLLIWALGMYYLFRRLKYTFWLCTTFYLYFILAFSWIYVAGRVILPFVFVNILVYLFGFKFLFCFIRNTLSQRQTGD